MKAAHKELEVKRHGAFARGEFGRLARVAHSCASAVAAASMPASWREALDLAGKRNGLEPGDFDRRAEAL